MMPPEVKKYLSRNIQSQFDKDPAIESGKVKKWILSGNQPFDLSTIKSNTLSKAVIDVDGRQITKEERSSVTLCMETLKVN